MMHLRMVAAVAVAGVVNFCAWGQTPPSPRVWTGPNCGDGMQIPAGGLPGVCDPDAGHAFIELVDAASNTWRIAGTVTDLDYLTVCAPEGAGAAFNISAIDVKYTNNTSAVNGLRVSVWGQSGRRIDQLGEVTQRPPASAGQVYIRTVILNDQMRGWNMAAGAFDSALLAPVRVHHIEELRCSNSIRINARLVVGHGISDIGVKSLHGSIIGYIGGPAGAENGSQPGGSTGSLLPLEAPEGSIGEMNAPANGTIINAGAGAKYELIRAAGFNACTNYGVANSDWARVDEFKVTGEVKGNLWFRSIGTAAAPNPGLDAGVPGWESDPKRAALQIGGMLDGVIVTGTGTGTGSMGGIFGQVIVGSAGPNARISIKGDVTNGNAAACCLTLPFYGKPAAALGDGTVGGSVAVGGAGVVNEECVPAGTVTTPGALAGCDYLGSGGGGAVTLRMYAPVMVKNASLPVVIVERDDAPGGAGASRWTDVTGEFDAVAGNGGLMERGLTLVKKSGGVWYPGRVHRVRPNLSVPAGETMPNLRSMWVSDANGLSTWRAPADWRYTFVVGGCYADIGRQGGVSGGDGSLNNNDFIVYIDWFFNTDSRADMGRQGGLSGGDGAWDNNDFAAYIDAFFSCTPATCRVEDGTVYVVAPEMWEGD